MHKLAGFICLEKFVQIKSKFFDIVIRKFYALFHTVTNNVGHLIGEKGQSRQIGIRIFNLAGSVPVPLLFLLVGICPVVDCALRELVICQSLKRRARKVQRPFSPDMIKCSIGLIGIHAFMGFVYDENIPCQSLIGADFREFVKSTSEID